MTKRRIVLPTTAPPFVDIPGRGGGVFLNLAWNWTAGPLEFDPAALVNLLAHTPPGAVMLLRRLSPAELRTFRRFRDDVDAESFAHLIVTDDDRWRF